MRFGAWEYIFLYSQCQHEKLFLSLSFNGIAIGCKIPDIASIICRPLAAGLNVGSVMVTLALAFATTTRLMSTCSLYSAPRREFMEIVCCKLCGTNWKLLTIPLLLTACSTSRVRISMRLCTSWPTSIIGQKKSGLGTRLGFGVVGRNSWIGTARVFLVFRLVIRRIHFYKYGGIGQIMRYVLYYLCSHRWFSHTNPLCKFLQSGIVSCSSLHSLSTAYMIFCHSFRLYWLATLSIIRPGSSGSLFLLSRAFCFSCRKAYMLSFVLSDYCQ